MTAESNTSQQTATQKGPPLIAVGSSFAVLTIISLVMGGAGPRLTSSTDQVLTYYATRTTEATVFSTVVFAGAIPLAIWAAVAYRRLRQLGVTAPGTAIGFAGGLLAAMSLALSGLAGWTAAESVQLGDGRILRVLNTLSFAAGGPGFVVPFALLIAGVAVPSLILRFIPRPVAWAGLVIAGLGMLSVLSLLFPVLFVLVPIGRFLGLAWLLTVSVQLPRSRPRRNGPQRSATTSTE